MRLILSLMILMSVCVGNTLAQAPTPKEIEAGIEKGKAFLYSLQKPDGTWERVPAPTERPPNNDHDEGQWGGRTALAVYALLTCGEKATEPRLQKAIQFLHEQPIVGTYALAIKCQVWLNLPATDEVKKSMRRDVSLLMQLAKPLNQMPVWDYGPMIKPRKEYSLSRSQYAALGLWAANESGIEIPPNTWRAIEATWEAAQTAEGGWKYQFPADAKGQFEPTTVSMTASALATLYIAQDFTKSDYYAGARGNAISPPIEKGMAWMVKNFEANVAVKTPPPREFPFVQLYSIERTGLASGLRRFGPHDWYAIGARFILKSQGKEGAVAASSYKTFDTLVNTSFGILFLQRGRTPVAFNKLDYSPGVEKPQDAIWNQRPREIANITRWLSGRLERELRWQIVRSDSDLGALLESPILYLSGDRAMDFKPETKALLKSYIEHGGLIIAHADGGKDAFTRSIMKLSGELFPKYEWRDLPDSHPIWNNQNYKRDSMKGRVAVKALGNGVRELMLLLPTGDPARFWQLRNTTQRTETWETMANIYSYVTDKTTAYPRGYTWLADVPTSKPTKTITVGRLKYEGNWDPEPQAIVELSKYATNTKGIALDVKVIDAGAAIDKSIKLLLVSGTSEFVFDDASRKAISDYVNAGGTVLFESTGGMGGFAASAETELAQMFGAGSVTQLPKSHPIFGTDLSVTYRTFNMASISNVTGPSLRGVEKDGRVVALMSREDLSAGWLGIPTDGIIGYSPESARAMMTQVLGALK